MAYTTVTEPKLACGKQVGGIGENESASVY